MKKISFIALYFGKLPCTFQVFLDSCKYNPTIRWYFFTDDRNEFDYPPNVIVNFMDFETVVQKLEDHCGFGINLKFPYKITDFKPAYGQVFHEYIQDTDFWGICDIDLIFGNIRNLITDSILDKHDKILTRGHFTLFRNTEYINSIYRKKINGFYPYKFAFTHPDHQYFDEWGDNGINYLFRHYNIPVYDALLFHDLYTKVYKFIPLQLMGKSQYKKGGLYLWDRGDLHWYGIGKDGLVKQEILYLHFQKRPMKVNNGTGEKLLIVPNEFIPFDGELDLEAFLQHKSSPVFKKDFWNFYYNGIKRKIHSIKKDYSYSKNKEWAEKHTGRSNLTVKI